MEIFLLASFTQVVKYIGYILIAILLLLLMITVHELGHYISGKLLGFGIEEFSIGFGPKLFSRTKSSGELFSIRGLPLGGYCSFTGEDSESDDARAFNNKKPWQRIIVLISGAFMNYVLALLIIILMFGIYGQNAMVTYVVDKPTEIYTAEYSFKEHDIILKANGKNVYLVTDLMDAIEGKSSGEVVPFKIIRDGKVQKINVKLRENTDFTNYEDMSTLYSALGVYYEMDYQTGQIQNGGLYMTGVRLGFFKTIGRSFNYSFKLAGSIFAVLGQLLTGRLGLSSMGGTVTTIAVTAEAISFGFRNVLNIASFIGVNLAVFNLLPFPALDGSRVVFTIIEWIRKKPINRKVEAIIHTVGFILLLLFAVFIDLQRCF